MVDLQFALKRMINNTLKYLLTFSSMCLIGILLLDYVILPNYVGYNNEHYLPDLRGEYVEKADYQLRSLGFKTDFVNVPYSNNYSPGTVIKMHPRAFTKVKEGRSINLTVAGKMIDIIIPNFINSSLRNAKLEIHRKGLGIDTIIYEYDNTVKDGKITFQLPRSGKVVKSFTNMTLGVSRGVPPDYYIVPDVVNLSLRRAQEEITKTGLRLGDINYEFQPELLNNTVIEQNMTPGMRVSFPASIHLLVSIDTHPNK